MLEGKVLHAVDCCARGTVSYLSSLPFCRMSLTFSSLNVIRHVVCPLLWTRQDLCKFSYALLNRPHPILSMYMFYSVVPSF